MENIVNLLNDHIEFFKKGGIYIKPENRGKFNATKKRTGKTTEELTHSKNPVTRKRAIFAQNAAKWHKKKNGGIIFAQNNNMKAIPKKQVGGTFPANPASSFLWLWNKAYNSNLGRGIRRLVGLENNNDEKLRQDIIDRYNLEKYGTTNVNEFGMRIEQPLIDEHPGAVLLLRKFPSVGGVLSTARDAASTIKWGLTTPLGRQASAKAVTATLGSMVGGQALDKASEAITGKSVGHNIANAVGSENLYNNYGFIRFGFDALNPGYLFGGSAGKIYQGAKYWAQPIKNKISQTFDKAYRYPIAYDTNGQLYLNKNYYYRRGRDLVEDAINTGRIRVPEGDYKSAVIEKYPFYKDSRYPMSTMDISFEFPYFSQGSINPVKYGTEVTPDLIAISNNAPNTVWTGAGKLGGLYWGESPISNGGRGTPIFNSRSNQFPTQNASLYRFNPEIGKFEVVQGRIKTANPDYFKTNNSIWKPASATERFEDRLRKVSNYTHPKHKYTTPTTTSVTIDLNEPILWKDNKGIEWDDLGLEHPELTKGHQVPHNAKTYMRNYKPKTVVGGELITTQPIQTKWSKFLQKSVQEQDDIVRYWNVERFRSLQELKSYPKEFGKFQRWINNIK